MKDEEDHIDFLETQLDLIKRIGLELYTQKHVQGVNGHDHEIAELLRRSGQQAYPARRSIRPKAWAWRPPRISMNRRAWASPGPFPRRTATASSI